LLDENGEEIVQLPSGAPDTSQIIEEWWRSR
jgi:hypothetical protein